MALIQIIKRGYSGSHVRDNLSTTLAPLFMPPTARPPTLCANFRQLGQLKHLVQMEKISVDLLCTVLASKNYTG
jgi:hypothetical protein